ncbi:purine and uridine phosphorylase [Aureobasidium pullulans]|nr:purine and uridine phosphorylase [Aureobasidium pullulans]
MVRTLGSYQIGWICALSIEAELAEAMLDEKHEAIDLPPGDDNVYIFGQINVNNTGKHHNVVIAWLPAAESGKAAAATVAKDMLRTFTKLKFGLMVGIAGGIWSTEIDVRLGDVVVGAPGNNKSGVVQYDHGKYIQGQEFVHRGVLDKAPKMLRAAISVMQWERKREPFLSHLEDGKIKKLAPRPAADILFDTTYVHVEGSKSCDECSLTRIRERPGRLDTAPRIHYGTIASGDGVVRNAIFAEKIQKKHDVLCFEMEAAGLDNFECLVIRGISDYADTHKNDDWHAYAASTAAAYAKELLKTVPLTDVERLPSIGGSGKSETAIKFVEQNRDSFWGIFWVNADTQDTAKQGYAKIASMCNISDTSVEGVKLWLANKRSPWLLILDNCDSENEVYPSFFPSGQSGSIIVTTRLRACQTFGPFHDMDKLGPEASNSLLLQACGDKYHDKEGHERAATTVIGLVDELAIALVHAGAYIRRGFCTLQEYPQRFQTQKKHTLQFIPDQTQSRYESVYTTFEISVKALSASDVKADRMALTLLRILAFLDHESVEEDIFKRALEYCQDLKQHLNTRTHVFEELQEAVTAVPYDVQPSQLVSKDHGPANGSRAKDPVLRKIKSFFQKKPRSSAAGVASRRPFIATGEEELETGQKPGPIPENETRSISTNETSEHDADDGEIDHLSLWHCEEFRSTCLFDSDTLSDIEISRVRLADLSLIRLNDKAISLHPLVHEWASIRLSTEERKQAWSQTVCVLALSTEGRRDWQTFTMSLQAHINACFKDWNNDGHDDELPLNLARGLNFHIVRQRVS